MNQQGQGNGGGGAAIPAAGVEGVAIKQEVNDEAQKRAAEQAALQQQVKYIIYT